MGRYRPPPPESSRYITPEGAAALRRELERLWKVERPRAVRAVAEAAALGDRSENAEYVYGKKRLREIDRRVGYLGRRLDEAVVVSGPPDDAGKVHFGAWVSLEDESGAVRRWRLAGADEADPGRGRISIDSATARALIGKSAGDRVTVGAPGGPRVWRVLAVSYQEDAP